MSIFRDFLVEEPFLLIGAFVNQFVVGLWRAELVEENFVAVNLRAQLVLLVRFVVTTVEKTAPVFHPGCAGEFYPINLVVSIFPRLDVAPFPWLPIRAGRGEAVGQQFRIIARGQAAQRNRTVFRQRVWIEQFFWLLRQSGGRVANILIL